MDRSVMESDPHAVLEGMAIGAYAVGAGRGFIYVRAEYPLAVQRLHIAIAQARERGFLGAAILGSAFSFDVAIVEGAGAFVCGEETALMQSVEGRQGMPRPRPPYPAVQGLWGRPTLINNVETFASVPGIVAQGAEEFASVGTKLSKGTKTFALTGKINNIGLVEVPMGITLREIVFRRRRRHPRRAAVQGRADRRAVGGVHTDRVHRHANRLHVAAEPRRHDGLGRSGRHGRLHLHGEGGPLLHGVLRRESGPGSARRAASARR